MQPDRDAVITTLQESNSIELQSRVIFQPLVGNFDAPIDVISEMFFDNNVRECARDHARRTMPSAWRRWRRWWCSRPTLSTSTARMSSVRSSRALAIPASCRSCAARLAWWSAALAAGPLIRGRAQVVVGGPAQGQWIVNSPAVEEGEALACVCACVLRACACSYACECARARVRVHVHVHVCMCACVCACACARVLV